MEVAASILKRPAICLGRSNAAVKQEIVENCARRGRPLLCADRPHSLFAGKSDHFAANGNVDVRRAVRTLCRLRRAHRGLPIHQQIGMNRRQQVDGLGKDRSSPYLSRCIENRSCISALHGCRKWRCCKE